MAIRLSGLNSGMDTESIVAELVKAKSEKKTKLEGDQKKLSWKQDAWKELNTKIYNLYSDTLSDMRLQGNFSKKTTKASNDAVSVITAAESPNCVQTLNITSMAKAGYLTGGRLSESDGESGGYKTDSLLSELGIEAGTKFTVTSAGEAHEIEITEGMKISDLVTSLKGAGINANFDAHNQRFYISAKETGKDEDFTITASDDAGWAALSALKLNENDPASEVVRIKGEDALITLNNVEYSSNTNSFEVNGLTITVNEETDETITLSTQTDTGAIYDMVKNFFKQYNELINEMDKLYNADSASKYDMLTDEEKEAMNEDDVEEWENKIKSALLRKDSTLGTVSSAMKQVMMSGVTMSDGSTMYLSDFGIETLGYFISKDNEKNAFHIKGDKDETDSEMKAATNKLEQMIATDPDKVAEFFSSLSRNLYEKLDDLMARTDYSSAFTVYNDKAMQEEYNTYKDKIEAQEELIMDYEDRYYKQFSAMEVAMAKINSQQSALSGLFGG